MAIKDQFITDRFAIYNGDCMEVMANIPDNKIHFSIYSPPFGGLYHYSSSERDLSNCDSYEEFFEHYGYVIKEKYRITMPGRMTAVHAMDIPSGNTGNDYMIDFSGDIIRAHEKEGWVYVARYCVWKEPLGVRNRTMAKNLAHKTIVDDASKCTNASADYLLVFRKKGENPEPIENPIGFTEYIGERQPPSELEKTRGWTGKQTQNFFSHWVWRQYASAFWDDIRIDRVLPYRECREGDDEKHVHPLQLDVIERAVILWSNEGDTVLTPFMGVGSEVYGAVNKNRKGIGIELKPAYYKQAYKNLEYIDNEKQQEVLF